MVRAFKTRVGMLVYVTELGVQENAGLDLHEGLEGVILGFNRERDIVLKEAYKAFLVRFPHASYFLLRDHFITERERDAANSQ